MPSTTLSDPTYRRVCLGLASALKKRGHTAETFDPDDARRLSLFKPEILHMHFAGHAPATIRTRLVAAALTGARLVLTFQDLDHPDLPRRTKKQKQTTESLVRMARRVTALTPELASSIAAAYPSVRGKLSIVGNGIGPQWFTPIRADRGGILAFARLSPYKGIDLLLWAFRALIEREPKARLVICGRDFSNGHYQKLARTLGLSDRVRFLGEVDERRLRLELSRSRFFVSSSRSETYGMAAIEAMASGRPVLATRTGVMRALKHGRDAYIVPPGDWRALERGMSTLWRNVAIRRKLAESGRRAASSCTWSSRAVLYERIYQCV